MLCMLCYVMLCYVMLCYVMLGYLQSHHHHQGGVIPATELTNLMKDQNQVFMTIASSIGIIIIIIKHNIT